MKDRYRFCKSKCSDRGLSPNYLDVKGNPVCFPGGGEGNGEGWWIFICIVGLVALFLLGNGKPPDSNLQSKPASTSIIQEAPTASSGTIFTR